VRVALEGGDRVAEDCRAVEEPHSKLGAAKTPKAAAPVTTMTTTTPLIVSPKGSFPSLIISSPQDPSLYES
jgi:hypothetical protein